jgi:hypothetical protein
LNPYSIKRELEAARLFFTDQFNDVVNVTMSSKILSLSSCLEFFNFDYLPIAITISAIAKFNVVRVDIHD